VFDLTHMSDDQRVAFMKSCTGEVCVTYKFPVRHVFAAAVAAAAIAVPMAAAACDASEEVVVTTGGIKDPASVQYVQNPVDRSIPELPVVYERQGAAEKRPASGGTTVPSSGVSRSREST
jgi:hypothetical protein